MAGFSSLTLDKDTAQGLQRGDPVAQAEAYRILAPAVMGMALRILGDRGLAEEVVQDTFVSVIERADTLRHAAAAIGWIRQTAVNHCLMRLRSPWQKKRLGEPLFEEPDPCQSTPRSEDLRDLEQALGRVGPETRMVLWLHDVEGYTHQEIGDLFGKSSSYSKSQLARGYQKLLDIFGGEKDVGIARAADVGTACAT